MRSMLSHESSEKSNAPVVGSLSGTPSSMTSTWLLFAPRMKMLDALPALPDWTTFSPTTERRRSPTLSACRRSMSLRDMTVMKLAVFSTGHSMRVAVTTISGPA